MTLRLRTVLPLSLLAVPMTGAFAADIITIATSANVSPIPVHDEQAADWGGFYAGIYGVGQASPVSGNQFGLGVMGGVNLQFDVVLVGAEVAVHGLADAGAGSTAYGQVLGHAGLIVTEDVALYAAAGYGLDLGPANGQDFLVGGGINVAVTDDVSLRAQYLHGFPISGGNAKDQFTLGASFHF